MKPGSPPQPADLCRNDAYLPFQFEKLPPILSQIGIPLQFADKFVTPGFRERPGVGLLVGLVDGSPACTSAYVMSGDQIGVYWVATLEKYRRRGLGAAVTWAAIAAGRGSGGTWASLGASELGRPVYERMGFETRSEYVKFEPAGS